MLILVMGLPGSGKTFFSENFAQAINAVHINSDIVRRQIGKLHQYDEATKNTVYQEVEKQVMENLQSGKTVIVDATFSRKDYRTNYYDLAEKNQVALRIIEVKASEASIKQRMQQKRKYSEADFSVYEKIKAAADPLGKDHLVLASDELSIEQMIKIALNYLKDKAE